MELCQSLGVTTLEEEFLRKTRNDRLKFERRISYAFIFIAAIPFYKLFKMINSTAIRIGVILFYGLFVAEISYNLGRHIGGFIVMKPLMNRLLNTNKGDSIIAAQSYLFVKTCLIEEVLIKNKKIKPPQWNRSFVVDQVFGSFIGKYEKKLSNIKEKLL